MQPVFDAPMRADDCVEALGRQRRAEQIIGGIEGCFARGCADAFDLANSGQALAAGAVERAAQNLAVDRHNTLALLGETGLKR